MSQIPNPPQRKLMIFSAPHNWISCKASYLPHLPVHKLGICKSALEPLSPSPSRNYAPPSPTDFACWVPGGLDSFPLVHQHLSSLSFCHPSLDLYYVASTCPPEVYPYSSYTHALHQRLFSWLIRSTVHHCSTPHSVLWPRWELVPLVPFMKPCAHSTPSSSSLPPQASTMTRPLLLVFSTPGNELTPNPHAHVQLPGYRLLTFLASSPVSRPQTGDIPLLDKKNYVLGIAPQIVDHTPSFGQWPLTPTLCQALF